MIATPEGIEKALYEMIDKGVTVRGTGFVVRGVEGKITILESVDEEPTPEALFLRRVTTAEGVEDTCIRLLVHGDLDLMELLDMARDRGMVNEVGCYLDIINDIKRMVEPDVIDEFHRHVSKRRSVFLKEEKRYGKGGWVAKYEKRWNLDIYLDLDAIKHGVRSI